MKTKTRCKKTSLRHASPRLKLEELEQRIVPSIVADWAEPNDSMGGAYNLGEVEDYNLWTGLNIHEADNEDWFSFETMAAGEADNYVRIEFTHALGDVDMRLYDSGGGQIGSSTGVGDSEQISLNGLAASEYYIRVYGWSGATNPDYSLTIDAPLGNAVPAIDHLTAVPDPVTRPNNITLTAYDVTDADGTIAQVEFYRDINSNGVLDVGVDDYLGLGTDIGGDDWQYTGSTNGFDIGVNTFFTRAQDNDSDWSNIVSDTATVNNASPAIDHLVAIPDPVTRPNNITLTAYDVTDADGTIAQVEFYRDANSNGVLDVGVDDYLGLGTDIGGDDWRYTGSTNGFALGVNTFFTRAQDNDSEWSNIVSDTATANNASPAIDHLVAIPDPVTRPNNITLTAYDVTDADGTIAQVEFYRDANSNGVLDVGVDDYLGLGADIGGDDWQYTGSTNGFDIGVNTFFTRAQDNDSEWSNIASDTATANNAAPAIDHLTAVPDPVTRPNNITLTAYDVTDADGTIAQVEFYRDANSNGVLDVGVDDYLGLGTDIGGDDWRYTGSTNGFDVGVNTFFTRAQDNDSEWSNIVSDTATANNASPAIDHLTAVPDPVTRPDNITLTAYDVTDADGTIAQVEFYRDANSNGVLDVGVDDYLGLGTDIGGDDWQYTGSTNGFDIGVNTFFTRAQDNDSEWSNIVSDTATANNAAPAIDHLTAVPDPVTRPNNITLTAYDVTDADGTIAQVEFYRDVNSNGVLDVGIDTLLGLGTDIGNDDWRYIGSTNGFDIGVNTFFTRAQDNDSDWSNIVSDTATANNASPAIDHLTAVPDPVTRPNNITLTAYDVTDADGTIAQVEFYRDANSNGVLDVGVDTLLGLGTDIGGDDWRYIGSTNGFDIGVNTFFTRAQDNDSEWSNIASDTATANNAAPAIDHLTAVPDPVTRPNNITLTAYDVTDADGTIAQVEFYRDANSNGVLDVGVDDYLGLGTDIGGDDWRYIGSTNGFDIGVNTFFTRAQDNDSEWSNIVSDTATANNAVPAIDHLTAVPDPVTRPNNITLTAYDVTDADGTIAQVEFYRDANSNGVLDVGVDDYLGLGTDIGGDDWRYIGSTNGFDIGVNTFFTRAQDNDSEWSNIASDTATANNASPAIDHLTAVPDPVTRPDNITLTAYDVTDADGTIAQVEFYRDANSNGVLDVGVDDYLGLGTDIGGDDWSWSGSTMGYALGSHTFFTRAQDNDSEWSNIASDTATANNASPAIDHLVAIPDPVTRPNNITLTAYDVTDADGTIAQVEFYRDANSNGVLDVGVDDYLGLGTDIGGDDWQYTGSTNGFDVGVNTFFTRAQDNDSEWSNIASDTATANNASPAIDHLTAVPDPVTRPNNITLTAYDVTDADGTIAQVEFYRDANSNGVLDVGVDDYLGLGADIGGDNWQYTGSTNGFDVGVNTFFTRAQDNDSEWSNIVSDTATANNASPAIDHLTAVPDPVTRPNNITLTAYDVTDADGTIAQVEFYRDTNSNGVLDVGVDDYLGLGTDIGGDDWQYTGSTNGFDIGVNTFFTRAQDNDSEWSNIVSDTATANNASPAIDHLTAVPDPVTRPNNITLTAYDVTDADGTIAQVEFYRDANSNGVLDVGVDDYLGLGTDIGGDNWQYTGSTNGFDVGVNTFFTRAQDNDSEWSNIASDTATVNNAVPTTDLTAAFIDPSDPDTDILLESNPADADGTVQKVEFYYDTNMNGTYDDGIDALIGEDTDGADGWTWQVDEGDLASGTNTFFARAQDNDSEWGDIASAAISKLQRGNSTLTFTDASGDLVTVRYNGKGWMLVQLEGGQTDNSDIGCITVTSARRNSNLVVESTGSTPVGSIDITGRRFGVLDIDGDLDSLAFNAVRAVKNIIVSGTLGDVDASSAIKINLIQADEITGDIDAQRISHLAVSGDMNGAVITAGGSSGKIYDMNVGGDVLNCAFSMARGMDSGYVGGDVVNSIFDAYGSKADIDDLEVAGSFSGTINVGRDLKSLDVGGALNADITVARDIRALLAGELSDCIITAGRRVSSAVFNGPIYGAISANEIVTVRTYEYFRNPGNLQQDSYLNHLFSVEPLDPSKIFDADGDMTL